jgi:D-alanyl-D-alanine carboxypeptidase
MSDMQYKEPSSATTLEDLAASWPGPGRPISDEGRVPADLVDTDRGLWPQPATAGFLPRGAILHDPGPSFSVNRFANQLRNRLSGNAKGWAFAINTNGVLAEEDAGGDARAPSEGRLAMTPGRRLNIASVSKTITAVAVLRLLEEVGLTIHDRIWPFLPDTWMLGPGVTSLRFRHLLTHQSRLVSTNTNFQNTLSYTGLAATIQTGAVAPPGYNYLNANFALFRVIIPTLWRAAGQQAANNDTDAAANFFYAIYIMDELFGEMGDAIGQNASTSELDANPTLYYNTVSSNSGISMGNWAALAGGGGWHLSARELAAFLAHITYNDDVLSPAVRAQMDALALGWSPLNNTLGQFGQYLAHGGSITILTAPGGRVRTAIVKFSIQCEVALVANSSIEGSPDPVGLAIQSFDAAWS